MKARELRFSDSPMFDRVMSDAQVCREVIEVVLGVEIGQVVYHNVEQVVEPALDSRGVRLDAYLKGGDAVYDVEMQSYGRMCIDKRFRYYQSAIDTTLLRKGEDYDLLPDSFIIFVCTEDPYGLGLPRYDFERICAGELTLRSECGSHWVVLNASAYKDAEGARLRSLLKYVDNGAVDADPLIERISGRVDEANRDRKWVEQMFSVMSAEEDAAMQVRIAERVYKKKGLEEGRAIGIEKGRAEGRLEGLEAGRAEGLKAGRAEGLEVGRAEGLEAGRAEGRVEAERRYGELVSRLIAEGRLDDLQRAAEEGSVREALYEELGI